MRNIEYRFAYVKFADQAGVDNALKLNGTAFKGRNLKVTHIICMYI